MRKRIFSILMALALCLTLLPTAALATDTSGHWAEETIAEWQQKGYVSGYGDGTFRPDNSITRAEFVKLLNRVLGLTAEAAISFPDVKESDWFYAEVAKAAAAGYAKGSTDGAFHPDAPITRAEAAVMLARALELAANEGRAAQFADAAAISKWAKGSVGAVADAGYMTGYPNGAFGAKDSITRAQAVVTLDRVQNVTVTADGTVLADKTIAGDLIIAESVGEGEVTLKNVTVEGSLIIRGGGANSVYLDGVTVRGEVRLEKDGLHLRLQGGTKLGTVQVLAKVKLSGSGTIELLLVSADGVTIDRTLTVGKTEIDSGVKAPTVYNPDSSGSSSGGTTVKVITGVAAVAPVKVPGYTDEAVAMSRLPSEVTLNCADGSTVSAAVKWTLDKAYAANPSDKTVYTATGTVTLPSGYTYSGGTLTVQTTLTVVVKGIRLNSMTEITLQPQAPLDSSYDLFTLVGAKSIDVSKATLTVTPAVPGLQFQLENTVPDKVSVHITGMASQAGDYTLSLRIPAEAVIPDEDHYIAMDFTGDITCKIQSKVVSRIEVLGDINLKRSYNTSEDNVLTYLSRTINVNLWFENGYEVADVTWKIDGYDPTPDTTKTYKVTGTVTLPAGCTYSGTLKVTGTITVAGPKQTITGALWPTAIEVACGTSEDDVKKRLPSEIGLITYDLNYIVFVPVTWVRQGEYDPQGEVRYTGTATIPDIYEGWNDPNFKTGEIRIVFKESGQVPTTKTVSVGGIKLPDASEVGDYTTDLDTIRDALPTKAYLKCEGGSYIVVTLDPSKWTFSNSEGGTTNGQPMSYIYSYTYNDTLPAGYAWEEGASSAEFFAAVTVPGRDNTELQTALDAAWGLLDSLTDSEMDALTDPDKIYTVSDDTATTDVATGVTFVEENQIEAQKSALETLLNGKRSAADFRAADNENQAWVDLQATNINSAAEALQTALKNVQKGTGYTTANILQNVKDWLGEENRYNYAYSKDKQPLTPEKHDTNGILLPDRATGIQISNNVDETVSVYLKWSIGDTTYASLMTNHETGSQYVQVKGTNTEPQNLSLTVYAISYQDPVTSDAVFLNETNNGEGVQAAIYNCIIGAPLRRAEAAAALIEKPKLTAGEKDFPFEAVVPFLDQNAKIETIDKNALNQIEVENISTGGALLSDLKVTAVEKDSAKWDSNPNLNNYSAMKLSITATAAQLPAVVDPTTETDHVARKVRITIPKGAVKLTEWATKQGYYIPDGGLVLDVDVDVYKPAVKVTEAKLDDGGENVKVTFDAEHWSSSYKPTVYMALVPEAGSTVESSAPQDNCVVASGNGTYDVSISASNLAVDTTYNVWVKIGDDGEWTKTSTTYTHPADSTTN